MQQLFEENRKNVSEHSVNSRIRRLIAATETIAIDRPVFEFVPRNDPLAEKTRVVELFRAIAPADL